MSDMLALYGTTEPPARSRRLSAGPPEADLVAGLAALSGLRSRSRLSSDRSAVDGVAATGSDGSVRPWIANLSPSSRKVRLPSSPSGWRPDPEQGPASKGSVSVALDRIELEPYAVVRLDSAASTPSAD